MSNPLILHDNCFDDGTPAASPGTASGYSVLSARVWRAWPQWLASDATQHTITVDCAATRACDYVFLYNHTLGSTATDPGGRSMQVRASTDNFAASDVAIASWTQAVDDDDPVFKQFNSASYRYWRLVIGSGASAPAIGLASIGAALTIPGTLPIGFSPRDRKVLGNQNRTMKGHATGSIVDGKMWEESVQIQGSSSLTWDWLRNTFDPAFENHLSLEPFGLVWDPTGYPGEVYLCESLDKLAAPHRLGSRVDLNLTFRGWAS